MSFEIKRILPIFGDICASTVSDEFVLAICVAFFLQNCDDTGCTFVADHGVNLLASCIL